MTTMKHFVQLKDGVVFAHHQSPNDLDTSGDNIIEVDGNEDLYINKKFVDGLWINAPVIKYALIDTKNNTVVGIKETLFSSEVTGIVITNPEVDILWIWDGENFNSPEKVKTIDFIPVDLILPPTS